MRVLWTTTIIALGLAGCGQREAPQQTTDAGAQPAAAPAATTPSAHPPHGAAARLAATEGNSANGALALTRVEEGVRIAGSVQGLPPNGEFGFHIHERGDCSAPDASSAGGHFNPTGADHGNPTTPPHHAGDMQNITSNAEGAAEIRVTNAAVSLHTGEPNDILGKAIVLHAGPDDYSSQPSGESGSRIACGVIEMTGPDAGAPAG